MCEQATRPASSVFKILNKRVPTQRALFEILNNACPLSTALTTLQLRAVRRRVRRFDRRPGLWRVWIGRRRIDLGSRNDTFGERQLFALRGGHPRRHVGTDDALLRGSGGRRFGRRSGSRRLRSVPTLLLPIGECRERDDSEEQHQSHDQDPARSSEIPCGFCFHRSDHPFPRESRGITRDDRSSPDHAAVKTVVGR